MTFWGKLKSMMGFREASKKKPVVPEDSNVGERKHPYEECHPEDEEDKPDPGTQEQYKAKVQRPYEDIDVDFKPENPEAKDSNNSRLSQKPGELNYVDVEFTKPKKKKKKSKKEKEQDSSDIPQPSVEYSEVIVKNSTPSLK
ncbi:uncharacterized protein LOC111125372 isoform X3 [Crassostrea virginica]